MTSEYTECPNCGAKLKTSLFSYNEILSINKINIINEYHPKKAAAYCGKCGDELYKQYQSKSIEEKDKLSTDLQVLIEAVPVVSLHSPQGWNYDILGMVTGQSTTGTGVVSEFTSSFTDFFGMQSGSYNKKIKAGENLCFAQLRKQALDMGGNAVIGTDIDYSEVGGEKGMLMVCMAGTAIKIKNTESLGTERNLELEQLIKLYKRLKMLNRFNTNENW
ncbi:heavy metal-binding domain-containing protein [Runella sp.]|uniref:heavy metal-binding domain-containing protein n=1 Tax=Runella sp. TaxID=1960881 RepID=UPI003019BB62